MTIGRGADINQQPCNSICLLGHNNNNNTERAVWRRIISRICLVIHVYPQAPPERVLVFPKRALRFCVFCPRDREYYLRTRVRAYTVLAAIRGFLMGVGFPSSAEVRFKFRGPKGLLY